MSLLFHVLYSNPVILYAPNTTLVTEALIRKSNGTFELLDQINAFFRQWLQTSGQLVAYLKHEQTNKSMESLQTARSLAINLTEFEASSTTPSSSSAKTTRQPTTTTTTMARNLTTDFDFNYNETTRLSLNSTQLEENLRYLNSIRFFERLPNRTVQDLIDRIEMIDSAACSWLSLMSGVNLNLFKGFANENDLVKYFLEKVSFII